MPFSFNSDFQSIRESAIFAQAFSLKLVQLVFFNDVLSHYFIIHRKCVLRDKSSMYNIFNYISVKRVKIAKVYSDFDISF